MRERLERIVAEHPGLLLAAAVGTCREARAALAGTHGIDIALVDLGLPDGDGIALMRDIRRRANPPEVMVVSVFGDEGRVVAALEAGATGYLLKDAKPVVGTPRHLYDRPMSDAASSRDRHTDNSSAKSSAPAARFCRHQSSIRRASSRAASVRTTLRFTTSCATQRGLLRRE
jgi:DNA-binding NarL/FixJ family response regulator